ncbi:MAG: peptidoglycan-binding protein, partial [Minisyncoccota bacterium]
IFSTSYTGNPGDSVTTYNQFEPYDITDDYAFTNSPVPALKTPPAFYTAPGNPAFSSAPGVEWEMDPVIYTGSLSGATAANTGVMSWLRLNHPTWNWFDVKAAIRQSAANWTTGYNGATYGFGLINATTTNALADNQILLQPPEVATSTSGMYNQLTFTIFPFRQTRRAKDVLFEFSTNPGLQLGTASSSDLTLAQIQALGGTKVAGSDYSGNLATTTTPFFTAVSNAYFVWFTVDSANDTASTTHFSRIDTYSDFGPLSQPDISFNGTFDLAAPANNVAASQTPTFSWSAASSYLGISKYQLFIDGSLNTDNISGTSAVSTGTLSPGTHTWYIKAFNGGKTATTSVSTYTINVVPGYAPGYTFYVDNVLGNDNNVGSQASPWATLAKAAGIAGAGDTVIIIKNANTPYRERLSPTNSGTTFEGLDALHKPEIWGSTDVSNSQGAWSLYSGTTYQKAVATQPKVVAEGPSISSLTKLTEATSTAALTPGEWYWSSGTLYYDLQAGENITTIHVEAGTRGNGIASNGSALKNIVVRYANSNGVNADGGSIQGIEVYDSFGSGIITGSNSTINYCAAVGNGSYGIWSQYGSTVSIYNSLMYGNGISGANFDVFAGDAITLQNNISSGNSSYSFSFNYFFGNPIVTASNNAWDIAGDSHWNTYKGTNNQELVNSLFTSTSTRTFTLASTSPDIDAGTNVGLTSDILDNPIYGTPDIGPYEYQPPYSVTSGSVPTTGSLRIYNNGAYRMLTASSSPYTANLTLTPTGGFPSGNYSQWLDMTVNSWATSTPYAKSWTASSSAATSTTAYTIGDLAPSAWYTVSVDGTPHMTLESSSSDTLPYTYTAGYASPHTFTLALSSVPLTLSSPSDGTTFSAPPSLSWSWNTADGTDLAKYQLYIDGSLAIDDLSSSATSVAAPSTLSCGTSHNWYVQAVDNQGNTADSATRTFTISCGSMGSVSGYSPNPAVSTVAITTPIVSTTTTASTASSTPPSLPHSGALSSVQIQSILSLLSSFGADSTVIAHVEAALTGTPASSPSSSTTAPSVSSCSFTRDLTIGKEGKDVTCLQNALIAKGYIIPDGATGYFGLETQTAVASWQTAVGVMPVHGYFGEVSRGRWEKGL